MESTPFVAKIDNIGIILTISHDTIYAKTKDGSSVFNISIIDLVFCNVQANKVILNWNTGNTISSAVISSKHARNIVKEIKQKI